MAHGRAVLRDGAGRRPQPRRRPRGDGGARGQARARPPRPRRDRGDGLRPQPRHRPPRSQAGQRARGIVRRDGGHRLGARQGSEREAPPARARRALARRRRDAHGGRRHPRHAGLHAPRAGPRPASRRARRRLRAGRHHPSPGRGRAPLQRQDADEGAPEGAGGAASAPGGHPARGARGALLHRVQGDGPRGGRPLPRRARAGGGSAPLHQRAASAGAPLLAQRPAPALHQPLPGHGGGGRRRLRPPGDHRRGRLRPRPRRPRRGAGQAARGRGRPAGGPPPRRRSHPGPGPRLRGAGFRRAPSPGCAACRRASTAGPPRASSPRTPARTASPP